MFSAHAHMKVTTFTNLEYRDIVWLVTEILDPAFFVPPVRTLRNVWTPWPLHFRNIWTPMHVINYRRDSEGPVRVWVPVIMVSRVSFQGLYGRVSLQGL